MKTKQIHHMAFTYSNRRRTKYNISRATITSTDGNIECDFSFIIIRPVRIGITRHIVICVRLSYVFYLYFVLRYYFILFSFSFWIFCISPHWPIEIVHALVYCIQVESIGVRCVNLKFRYIFDFV